MLGLNPVILQLVGVLSILQQSTNETNCSGLLLEGIRMFNVAAGAIVFIVAVIVVLVMLYRGGYLAFGGERERVESTMIIRQTVIALIGFIILAYALGYMLQNYVFADNPCKPYVGWPHDWLAEFFKFLANLGQG